MSDNRRRIIQTAVLSMLFRLHRTLLALSLAAGSGVSSAASPESLRIALDDIPGVDMLIFLTAVEQAKERGLDITVEYLRSEDIAVQAVLQGQADMGMGAPYAIIQKSDAPVRIVYQLNTLRFFPVVNTDFHTTWKDLDGADIYTHGRGSGTEAIMESMAKMHGITYKTMNYLPGSEVRARAMLQGRINASIVDSRRRNMLLETGRNRFAFLPIPDVHASDETLYVRKAYLDENSATIVVLLEELLKVWREVNQNPDYMVATWKRYGLLPSHDGKDLESEIRRYYSEMVEVGAFPNNGGGLQAALADFEFYGFAGSLEGDVTKLRVEDYWDLKYLKQALSGVRKNKK